MKTPWITIICLPLALAGCRPKPACFECGLTEEWARAEQREGEGQLAEDAEQGTPEQVDEAKVSPQQDAQPETTDASEDAAAEEAEAMPEPPLCDDATEIAACETKGDTYVYGRKPIRRCGGAAPSAEERERMRMVAFNSHASAGIPRL